MTDLTTRLEKARKPLFVTHAHADRDAVGAAVGLRSALGRGTVCTPDGVAKPAQPLLEATGTEPVADPSTASFDRVVVLDAPSSDRIGGFNPDAPLLIDHHEPRDLASEATATRVETDSDATAALVAELVQDAGWELTPDIALPLAVGVFADTGNLTDADAGTVRLAARLLGALGKRADDFGSLLGPNPDPSEATAETLGTLRARGYRASDRFLAFTRVGGHEAAAATSLRDAGVDCAVVVSARGADHRVVVRASDTVAERANLGRDLLPALADEFGGDGGGHAAAGVATLETADAKGIERFVREFLESELGVTFRVVDG